MLTDLESFNVLLLLKYQQIYNNLDLFREHPVE